MIDLTPFLLPLTCGEDREVPAGRCVLCNEPIEHVNDNGTGWLVHVKFDGEVWTILYHGQCEEAKMTTGLTYLDIWRCGCIPDFIENLGDRCTHCDKPRSEAVPFCHSHCPKCNTDFATTDRKGIGNQSCCPSCGHTDCDW